MYQVNIIGHCDLINQRLRSAGLTIYVSSRTKPNLEFTNKATEEFKIKP